MSVVKITFFSILIAILSSASSMAYQITLAKQLSSISNNYVLSQSITLGVFLFFMGLGSLLSQKVPRLKSLKTLYLVEMFLIVLMLFTNFFIWSTHLELQLLSVPENYRGYFLVFAPQILTALVSFFCGFEIPLLVNILSEQKKIKNSFGTILFSSYLGSALGTLLVLFVAFPMIGSSKTILVLAIVAWLSLMLISLIINKIQYYLTAFILVFLAFSVIKFHEFYQQNYLKGYYYYYSNSIMDTKYYLNFPNIQRLISRYQEIDLVKSLINNNQTLLNIDLKLQFSTAYEKVYHDSLVHGGVSLSNKIPEEVVVLGGGDGLAVRELLRYPEIKKIVLIELDEKIVSVFSKNKTLKKLTQDSLSSERLQIIYTDAYKWVQSQKPNSLSAVFVDFPHPYNADLSRLYSVEFYYFLYRTLKPDGFIILDYPLNKIYSGASEVYPTTKNDFIFPTLNAAGFKNIFPFGPKEAFIFCEKSIRSLSFNEELLFSKISDISISNASKLDVDLSFNGPINSIFKPYFLISGAK